MAMPIRLYRIPENSDDLIFFQNIEKKFLFILNKEDYANTSNITNIQNIIKSLKIAENDCEIIGRQVDIDFDFSFVNRKKTSTCLVFFDRNFLPHLPLNTWLPVAHNFIFRTDNFIQFQTDLKTKQAFWNAFKNLPL